jgi:voltage-gated potassium channel
MPVGKKTLMALEQKAALPMATLTLLVLPVLTVELAYGHALDKYAGVALATHLLTSLIWLGFTVEFLWMVAAAPKRLNYCMQHWINLVIILVPLVAFLRVLNMLRLSRMVRAGRLLRAYRLRGLSSRIWRLVMLFNLFERFQQRDPAKYCVDLEAKIADLEEEMNGLRVKLAAARKRIPPPTTTLPPPPSAPVGAACRELVEK